MLTHCTCSLQTAVTVQSWGCQGTDSPPTPPSPTLCPLVWYKVGRNPRVLHQGSPSFQKHRPGWSVCPFKSVRCTLLLYQIPPPAKCSSGRGSCQKHWYEWKKGPATIPTDKIALLNAKMLDLKKSLVFFFLIIKISPGKSLSYVQIKASKLLSIVYFIMFTYTFHFFKKKKMQTLTF